MINGNGNDDLKKNLSAIPSEDQYRHDAGSKELLGRLKEANNIVQTAKFMDDQTGFESKNQHIIPKVQTASKAE